MIEEVEETTEEVVDLVQVVGKKTMTNIYNPCIRCGKARVVANTYKEVIGTSMVIRTENSCPDPDCQEKVERQLEKEREKRQQTILLHAANILKKKNKS